MKLLVAERRGNERREGAEEPIREKSVDKTSETRRSGVGREEARNGFPLLGIKHQMSFHQCLEQKEDESHTACYLPYETVHHLHTDIF